MQVTFVSISTKIIVVNFFLSCTVFVKSMWFLLLATQNRKKGNNLKCEILGQFNFYIVTSYQLPVTSILDPPLERLCISTISFNFTTQKRWILMNGEKRKKKPVEIRRWRKRRSTDAIIPANTQNKLHNMYSGCLHRFVSWRIRSWGQVGNHRTNPFFCNDSTLLVGIITN